MSPSTPFEAPGILGVWARSTCGGQEYLFNLYQITSNHSCQYFATQQEHRESSAPLELSSPRDSIIRLPRTSIRKLTKLTSGCVIGGRYSKLFAWHRTVLSASCTPSKMSQLLAALLLSADLLAPTLLHPSLLPTYQRGQGRA